MKLVLPIEEREVRGLNCGDVVTLDGTIYTGRDEMHLRALERLKSGGEMPVDLKGGAVFHCGPIVVKDDEGWRLIAAGPTTSARMDHMEPDFIRAYRPAVIIGKGGMSRPTVEAMRENGCVYMAMTGGVAALAAKSINDVKEVHWLDLGVPEALWTLEVEGLGPLIVAIDARGNSLYEQVRKTVERNLPSIRESLGLR